MEAKTATTMGRSLPVPCVREMVLKEKPDTVPQRYVRLEQDPPLVSYSTSLPQVPVIDMQKLSSDESTASELEKLHFACKDWGFFQLINHGVSITLMEEVKKGIQEWFNLPMEEKKKYWQREGDIEGFGQAFVVAEDQKLDWGDMFYMLTLPTHLRKPYLFPMVPFPFRDTLETYSSEMKDLALKILYLVAKNLNMDSKDIKDLFEDGWQAFRMNYYPSCPQPDRVIGLNPHSDCVSLTILLQINEMEGLQIRKDGQWIPVKPLRNAFVVNVGDILEIVTNGAYKSIEHRATVNSMKERLSIATFYSPKLDGEMGPAPSLLSPENPPVFKRVGVEEYFKTLFSRKLDGKWYIEAMKL